MTPNLQNPYPGFPASRRKTAGLMILALACGAGVAHAQPAATTTTPSEVVELDPFEVKGIRSSLTQALDIKRENVAIVDSVVAEDIGKFPDNNLIEALQRMPGVQVTNRGSGETSGIQIRGLPDINTTLNGQNIFTASGQALALQDIPASLLSRVDVYKTRTSDLIENGIAGSLNVVTHRPLDFPGNKVVLATRAIWVEQADKWASNTSALFSTRWDTGAGKVGALLNISYVRTPYRDQNVTAGAMVPFVTATPPAPWVPYERIFQDRAGVAERPIWQAGLEQGLPTQPGSTLTMNGQQVPYILSRDAVFQNDFTGTRERPSANLSLQWAPSDNAELTFETFYLGYENDSFNNLFFSFVDWWGGPHGAVTLYPGTNIVKSRARTPWVYGFTSGDLTHGETDNWFYSLSGKFKVNDALRFRSALTYQDSEFQSQFFAMRAERVHPAIAVDFNPGNGVPAFSFEDDPATANINESNMTDPRLWNIAQLYDNGNRNKGDAKTFTLDGDYVPTNWGIFTGLKFGGRYDVRGASEAARTQDSDLAHGGTAPNTPGLLGRPLSDFPELQHVNSGFFDGNSAVPTAWVVPNGYEIYNNAERYRQMYKSLYPAFQTTSELQMIENFNVEETTTNLYARGDFKTFIGDHRVDGQIGARYAHVKTDMVFRDRVTLNTSTGSAETEKILPSGSIRFALLPTLYLRASYAETLRRPNFSQLNPMIIYNADVTGIGYGTASGGNPNLRPTESKNYDLALEYYFGRSNLLALNLFKREVEGFVVDFRRRVNVTLPGSTPYDYVLSQPDNTSNGELMGWEANAQYFFDEVPMLNGFGVKASYTALDSEQDIPITNTAGQVTGTLVRDLFGVSKSSYNVSLLYERGKFSAALSYVWREAFLNNYEAALFANPLGINRRDEESLDFSLSYRVSRNIEITFDATNLTEPLYQSYYGNNPTTNNFSSSLYSRTFAIGARFDF